MRALMRRAILPRPVLAGAVVLAAWRALAQAWRAKDLRRMAWVKTDPQAQWPARLAVKVTP